MNMSTNMHIPINMATKNIAINTITGTHMNIRSSTIMNITTPVLNQHMTTSMSRMKKSFILMIMTATTRKSMIIRTETEEGRYI